ncbi:hypothetical protein JX266_002902 [Neoarthrinium moseri]|nr:hypothetical protein JX266_002902 [Neoarthrinium moseri]
MQRRNSTRSGVLSRQKSTSSVKSVQLIHIHPEAAERDAQSAAAQAFARAQERSSTDTTPWPPSRADKKQSHLRRQNSTPESRPTGPGLRKQQSVRFVQPQPSRSYLRSELTQSTPSQSADTESCITKSRVNSRPTGNASATGMVFAAKGAAGDYINALITGEEYYTPEDGIASAPSSYRRLRKSRSMLTSSEPGCQGGLRQSPRSATARPFQRHVPNSRHNNENRSPLALRAPRSMSFLGARPEPFSMAMRTDVWASGIPDDELLYAGIPSTLAAQPPTCHKKRDRPQKVFRKTLRDLSNGATTAPSASGKDGSLRKKARKVSQNFKHKIKSFFSVARVDNDDAVLPPQQIKSQKTHVTEVEDHDHHPSGFYYEHLDSENTTVSRVTSGIPSLHSVPVEQQLRSRQGSLESLHSEKSASDEKSRVTSWTDSETNTFCTMNSSKGEWEKQRLSVIKENGADISSPSVQIDTADSLPGHHLQARESQEAVPAGQQTDGQRLYSALMKRRDAPQQQRRRHRAEISRQQSIEDFVVHGIPPPRSSSRDRVGGGDSKPAATGQITPRARTSPTLSRSSSASTVILPIH